MRLKRIIASVLAILIGLSFASCADMSQSTANRRIPKLSTDDLALPDKPDSKETKEPDITPADKPKPKLDRQIAWERDLARALNLASTNDRLVIVDVYTDWCGWCKKMDQILYSNPEVIAMSRDNVFVKLDAEDGSEGRDFARRVGVKGYPTTVILNADGRVLGKITGYIATVERFVNFVEGTRNMK